MSESETPANSIHWDIQDTHPDLVPALRAVLTQVVDPELGLNILQLGLIRKVSIEDGTANIYMLLTTPFCPYGPAMIEITRQKATEGLKMPVAIQLGMEPWDFSMMEDPGILTWGIYT
jgi:metal-sulfur cluster biosynthetic enzyme